MTQDKTPRCIKLDDSNHVEKPLLNLLAGWGWKIIYYEKEAAGI